MKEDYLIKEIRKMSGNILCIGDFSDNILKTIDSNKNITICNILSDIKKTKTKEKGNKKLKKFSLKHLKKFKKKKVNYLIVNYEKIDDYINTFVKDSIYITKNYIYLYKSNNKIIRRYKHYNVEIRKHENLIIINTNKAKNSGLKELFYTLYDNALDAIDYISDTIIKG